MIEVVTITREEFEREFDVVPLATCNYVIIHDGYGGGTKFIFVGKKHEDIQKLERLYTLPDLRGDQSCTKQTQ